MKHAVRYLVLALLLVSPSIAQEMPETNPPVSQSQLELFLGSWKGVGTYEGEGNKYDFKVSFTGKYIVKGKAIEIDPSAEVKGLGPYREKSMIAWDPMQKQVTMMTVTNMGEIGKYVGDWVVGTKNTLVLKESKVMMNERYEVEHTFIFHDGKELMWRSLATKNGGAVGTFEGKFKKK